MNCQRLMRFLKGTMKKGFCLKMYRLLASTMRILSQSMYAQSLAQFPDESSSPPLFQITKFAKLFHSSFETISRSTSDCNI